MSERHSGHLSKAAAKQIRTVDVDFTYTRPGTNSQVGRRRGRDFEESIPSHGVGVSVVSTHLNNQNNLIDQVDGPVNSNSSKNAAPIMTTENFPSLGGRKAPGTANGSKLLCIYGFIVRERLLIKLLCNNLQHLNQNVIFQIIHKVTSHRGLPYRQEGQSNLTEAIIQEQLEVAGQERAI